MSTAATIPAPPPAKFSLSGATPPVPPQTAQAEPSDSGGSGIEIFPTDPNNTGRVIDKTNPAAIIPQAMPRQMEASAAPAKKSWVNRLELLGKQSIGIALPFSEYGAAHAAGQSHNAQVASDVHKEFQQSPTKIAGDTAGFLTGMVGTGGFGEGPEVRISPETFINKVSSPESHVNPEVVKAYRAQIRNGEPIEPLKIEMDKNGNVLNADGRHRALAAMQEGVKTLPVQVTRPTHGLKITTGTVAGHEVPPERSTGSFEADEAIRNGGGIPGGKFPKMGSMNSDLHMFHDPTTGSTLGMSADEISPTAVAKQLAENREIYAQAQAKKKLGIK